MLPLLLVKLLLAPALVAGASLAGRRFGPRVGGWLIGFPVVAGPILWFYAREQGLAFAAQAAAGTTMGIVSLTAFLVVYTFSALRFGWLPSVLLGWAGFIAATALLAHDPRVATAPWPVGLAAAFLVLTLARRARPRMTTEAVTRRPPRPDLLLRLVATAILVLSLTGAAHLLGPALSGLVTPFPVATSVLVVFAHRQEGAQGVLDVYRGFLPSLYSFATFCAALAFALPRWSLATSFSVALLICLLAQTIVLVAGARSPTTA